MTLEMFVVEQVIPSLDAIQKAQGTAQTLFTVEDEAGAAVNFRLVKDLAGGASARIFKSYTRDRNALKPIAIKRIEAAGFKGFEDEFEQLLDREKTAMEELSKFKNHVPEYFGHYYYPQRNEHWLAMELCDGGSIYHLAPYLFSRNDADYDRAAKMFPKLGKAFQQVRKQTRARSRLLLGLDAEQLENEQREALKKARRKTVNLKQVSAIAAGALRGLEVIHNAGFIHGDIKSGNILLCYPGIVKICDFGLTSKVVGVANPDYHALGTLDYMAPEQMLKSLALDHGKTNPERYTYDHKIDIWALGIIVLELLLGRTTLSELRREEEEEFSFFIANMCKPKLPQNKGSALGFFFYLPQYHEDYMRHRWRIRDRDLLCKRIPVLEENKGFLLEMLMRPHLYNRRPNPSLAVAKPKVGSLYQINRCLDFVAQCLYIKYAWRPNATQMQNHPFVKPACKELQRLEPKLESLAKMHSKWGERKDVWKKFRCPLTVHEIFKILEKDKKKQKEEVLKGTL